MKQRDRIWSLNLRIPEIWISGQVLSPIYLVKLKSPPINHGSAAQPLLPRSSYQKSALTSLITWPVYWCNKELTGSAMIESNWKQEFSHQLTRALKNVIPLPNKLSAQCLKRIQMTPSCDKRAYNKYKKRVWKKSSLDFIEEYNVNTVQ